MQKTIRIEKYVEKTNLRPFSQNHHLEGVQVSALLSFAVHCGDALPRFHSRWILLRGAGQGGFDSG